MKSRAPEEADISPYVRQATEGQKAADKNHPQVVFVALDGRTVS